MAAVAAAFLLLGVANGYGAVSVEGLSAGPVDPRAGANSDLSLSFDISTADGDDVKKLVVHLPPGLVGNPLATPTCSERQLNAAACPPASDVGDISNSIDILPLPVTGNVYNVQPRSGEPARFGFVLSTGLTAPIILQAPASLRPGDFGLDTTLDDLPSTAKVLGPVALPITITGVDLSLEGELGSPPQSFLRNPTSCGTNAIAVELTSYAGATASGTDSFDTTNCEAVPFSPEFSARLVQSGTLTNGVEVSTTISQSIEEAGLKRAQVTLPGDLAGNQAALASQCPAADFDAGTCPDNTRVGTATAASPLQAQPLTGGVYVVASGGVLPNLGLDLKGALALKLTGAIALTPDLRSQVTFDGLPDIPIADFTLDFNGGPGGLSAAKRDLCKPPPVVFDTSFLAHSGATLDLASPAKVKCIKDPTAAVKLKVPKRKGGDPVLKFAVKAGTTKLRSVKLKAPKGISFAHGKTFKQGAKAKADGKKVKLRAKGRSLTLKLKKKGARRLKGKLGGGAVRVKPDAGSTFTFAVRDVAGKKTTVAAETK